MSTSVTEEQDSAGLEDLSRELLVIIFAKFSCKDVARSRTVCKTWKAVLDEVSVRREIFVQYWGLARLIGEPRSPAYYLEANLSNFAHKHVCQRSDTLTGLAIKYGVRVQELKRLNNLISDFSLHARSHIHVPARSRQHIEGKVGQFILDPIACRHLVLLLEDSHSPLPATAPSAAKASNGATDADVTTDRLTAMVGRGLRVSKDTAKYYLHEARGDVKTAFALYGVPLWCFCKPLLQATHAPVVHLRMRRDAGLQETIAERRSMLLGRIVVARDQLLCLSPAALLKAVT